MLVTGKIPMEAARRYVERFWIVNMDAHSGVTGKLANLEFSINIGNIQLLTAS
jgi:general stress protein CsbA